MGIRMVYDRYARIKSLPGADGKMPRPFRVDEDWNVIYLDEEEQGAALPEGRRNAGEQSRAGIMSWEELDRKRDDELAAIRSLGEDKPIQLAEAPNPNWNGYEAMRAQGQRDGKSLRQFEPLLGKATGIYTQPPQAAADFIGNYIPMRTANTIGADKYFHCKANCQASSRGEFGEAAAETISNAREIVDQNIKGYPLSDTLEDQKANVAGRKAGKAMRGKIGDSAKQCGTACAAFRPQALNKKYR
jgi:hypothetical protein